MPLWHHMWVPVSFSRSTSYPGHISHRGDKESVHDFGLTQLWPTQPFGEWAKGRRILSLSLLCLSNKSTNILKGKAYFKKPTGAICLSQAAREERSLQSQQIESKCWVWCPFCPTEASFPCFCCWAFLPPVSVPFCFLHAQPTSFLAL